jgi:hypothetical protein
VKRGGPVTWWLRRGLTTAHHKQSEYHETSHRASDFDGISGSTRATVHVATHCEHGDATLACTVWESFCTYCGTIGFLRRTTSMGLVILINAQTTYMGIR